METGEGNDQVAILEKEAVEKVIMENNTKCFRLTENTPPMQEPLLLNLGYLGDTLEAEAILNGTYECPPEVDNYTREFLKCLQ